MSCSNFAFYFGGDFTKSFFLSGFLLCFILFKMFRTIVRQFSFVGIFFGSFLPSVDAHGNLFHAIIILAFSQCLHKRNLVCYDEEFFLHLSRK